ncbi:MAG: hypothetical protein AAGC67_17545, partial [Myxococcota bacterium]
MLARLRTPLRPGSKRRVLGALGLVAVLLVGLPAAGVAQDSDADGVPDSLDNCILDANPDQMDHDNDGFGTACDADYTGDASVTTKDFLHFLGCFSLYASNAHTYVDGAGRERFCGNTDHDDNGRSTVADFTTFLNQFVLQDPIGPSYVETAPGALALHHENDPFVPLVLETTASGYRVRADAVPAGARVLMELTLDGAPFSGICWDAPNAFVLDPSGVYALDTRSIQSDVQLVFTCPSPVGEIEFDFTVAGRDSNLTPLEAHALPPIEALQLDMTVLDVVEGPLRLLLRGRSMFDEFDQAYVYDVATETLALASGTTSGGLLEPGDGHTTRATITPDGRFVLFQSHAQNFAPGARDVFDGQLYVKDMNAPAALPLLVSARDGTAPNSSNGRIGGAEISDDGERIVFHTDASNLTSPPSTFPDQVYLKHRSQLNLEPMVVSSLDGTAATAGIGSSTSQGLSGDGRFALFSTDATSLIPGVVGQQIARKDLDLPASAVELVSSADGTTATQPAFTSGARASADGRFVFFSAVAASFVTGYPDLLGLFRKDMNAPATAPVLVSSNDGTGAAGGGNVLGRANFEISADGRYAAFFTTSAVLAGLATTETYLKDVDALATPVAVLSSNDGTATTANGARAVLAASGAHTAMRIAPAAGDFAAHRAVAATALVGVRVPGRFARAEAVAPTTFLREPSISADGRYVVFTGDFLDDYYGMPGEAQQIFRADTRSPTTRPELVSTRDGSILGRSSGDCRHPTISADGRYVAFYCLGSDLVDDVPPGSHQIYLRDMDNVPVLEPLLLSSIDGTPQTANDGAAYAPAISDDGRYVAFTAAATIFGGPLGNQIWRKDRLAVGVAPELVSTADGVNGLALSATGDPNAVQISGDGRFVVFATDDLTLVPGTPSGVRQVYRKDMTSPATPPVLVSSIDGSAAGAGDADSAQPDISADGRYVVFHSGATNLGAGAHPQVFARDLSQPTAAPILVSTSDGTLANMGLNEDSDPSISPDGQRIAWLSFS